MTPPIPPAWQPTLQQEITRPYFKALQDFLGQERAKYTVFPPEPDELNALVLSPFPEVRVLILGQDPYHDDGQAHGLAFSVRPGITSPPSLINIFRELRSDTGAPVPNNGCLIPWAEQGVLLLNAVLTVRAHQPASHQKKGWEIFTDTIIKALSEREDPLVFVLWGNFARRKLTLINTSRHRVIEGVHPSPLSANRGFFGSRPFSQINAHLRDLGQPEIDWRIPNL